MCEGACIHTTGGCGLELESEDHAAGTCQTYATRYTCYEELLLQKPDPELPLVVNCHSTC